METNLAGVGKIAERLPALRPLPSPQKTVVFSQAEGDPPSSCKFFCFFGTLVGH
jgi:hypothetical protein